MRAATIAKNANSAASRTPMCTQCVRTTALPASRMPAPKRFLSSFGFAVAWSVAFTASGSVMP